MSGRSDGPPEAPASDERRHYRPAPTVRNPQHARQEFQPFESWVEVEAVARELGAFGPLAIFRVGTGVRPEEALGADWEDVDLDAGVVTVRRAFAKGRLKTYTKTVRSRRRVPLRSKVVGALEELPRRRGILFPASEGGRINIDNFRTREWTPALKAAGVGHRRIHDMRHTFATWSLAGRDLRPSGPRRGRPGPRAVRSLRRRERE